VCGKNPDRVRTRGEGPVKSAAQEEELRTIRLRRPAAKNGFGVAKPFTKLPEGSKPPFRPTRRRRLAKDLGQLSIGQRGPPGS